MLDGRRPQDVIESDLEIDRVALILAAKTEAEGVFHG